MVTMGLGRIGFRVYGLGGWSKKNQDRHCEVCLSGVAQATVVTFLLTSIPWVGRKYRCLMEHALNCGGILKWEVQKTWDPNIESEMLGCLSKSWHASFKPPSQSHEIPFTNLVILSHEIRQLFSRPYWNPKP